MRELVIDEIEHVSGGYVHCTDTYWVGSALYGDCFFVEPEPFDPSGPPGGWQGGGPGEQLPPNWNDCQDRKTDKVADTIASIIQLQGDQHIREYGAFIWKDSQGAIHSSPLIAGTNYSIPGMSGQPPQAFGFDSWSQVVGVIHSHPLYAEVPVAGGGTEYVPTAGNGFELPSPGLAGQNDVSDWFLPDFLVDQGADAANFRQYIVYNGQVYEYDYYNNDNRGLTPVQRMNASQQGNYQPNAQC